MPKIALLLSGCGNMDGSEIHESVAAIIAIDQKGWEIIFTAPNINQQRTVSFIDEHQLQPRNALQEAARIARGKIINLTNFLLDDIDAIVIPGGLGVATTLCDFALKGSACTALPEVDIFLKNAHKKGIPIGAMCIAPVLVARCIPGVTVTIGNDHSTAKKISEMGCFHTNCSTDKALIDKKNKIVTTPAYMVATGAAQVYKGAVSMVKALEELLPIK